VDPQVIKNDKNSSTFAFALKFDQEVLEVVRVVVLLKDLIMNKASLLTDSSYQTNAWALMVDHSKLHSWSNPTL
jgi:hypothetical protein